MKLSLGIENLHPADQIEILSKELKAKEKFLTNLSEADLPYQSEVIEWTNSDGLKRVISATTADYVEASCLINNEIFLIGIQITKLQALLAKEKEVSLLENNDDLFEMCEIPFQLSY